MNEKKMNNAETADQFANEILNEWNIEQQNEIISYLIEKVINNRLTKAEGFEKDAAYIRENTKILQKTR